jgi:hypothetical protein
MAKRHSSTGIVRRTLGALLVVVVMSAAPAPLMAEQPRGTQAVFDHHLGAFAQGIDAILADYAESSVVIVPGRSYRGLSEIRGFFQAFLDGATPEFWKNFRVETKTVDGDVAYLVWSSAPAMAKATDTLLVRDGKIAVQTFTPFGG